MYPMGNTHKIYNTTQYSEDEIHLNLTTNLFWTFNKFNFRKTFEYSNRNATGTYNYLIL